MKRTEKELIEAWLAAEIHKAKPAPEFAQDAASVCVHCHREIRRVPGGRGTTWVHADSGAVVGSGAADWHDQIEGVSDQ